MVTLLHVPLLPPVSAGPSRRFGLLHLQHHVSACLRWPLGLTVQAAPGIPLTLEVTVARRDLRTREEEVVR